ncbi:MAG: ribulose-phosphate 3-epimerase [Sedimentisphaerales bacterium]|jgi:ribulose-phosphate 3-epimerase
MIKRRLPKPGVIEVAPSILSADFARLADELAVVKKAGVKMVHLDVMDGHFVPNITIGPPVVEKLREHSNLFFDAHLMITDPRKYAPAFVKAGVNNITFHIEVEKKPAEFIRMLHGMGVTAGVCLNPETPVKAIEKFAHLADMILVMTVHPGFGGQKFIASAAKKIRTVRNIVGPKIRVEVDGGIDIKTTPIVVGYGADTLVAGRAIFGEKNRIAAINALRQSSGQAIRKACK